MNPRQRRAVVFSRVASALVGVAAVAAFTGWFVDVPGLTALFLPGPTLKTNAALALACAAIATLFVAAGDGWKCRSVAFVFAIVPTVVGGLTLSEHLVGWDLGIDQLLATEPAGAVATTSPNRMGPPASSANLLLGIALLTLAGGSARRRGLAHLLAFISCMIAMLSLVGYAYGFGALYLVARYTGIALSTAVALLTLAIAVQAARPDAGLAALMCRDDEAGVFARRLLPAAILLPFGIGWLIALTFRAGILDAPFAVTAMVLVLITLLAGVIWQTGRVLERSLDARASAELALTASERSLREADQQKTEFLATLSHELRNPLAPIRFAVELLNGPPASAARARTTIERQVQHLTRLIDDLLDLTRITRNKLELVVRSSELRQLVTDAVEAVSAEIARGGHTVHVDLPPHAVFLNVDPDRVVQMLVNLLTNASRYSDAGGTISIGAVVDTADATIYVRDTGHGIEQPDLDRVFERFVQVGKAHHGGLGIGLALVRALAELHGGSVEALSAGAGQGAEFRLRLPRSASPAHPAAVPAAASVPSRRILVVDDNRDAAEMLGTLLTSAGHHVLVAYDAESALRQAAAFLPEFGLLDIGMAGMDGYELARQLRRDGRHAGLYLVAITGWGQEDDRRRAVAAGFDAHLTKPADPAAIEALIGRGGLAASGSAADAQQQQVRLASGNG